MPHEAPLGNIYIKKARSKFSKAPEFSSCLSMQYFTSFTESVTKI